MSIIAATPRIRDCSGLLRQAIAQARAAGIGAKADEREAALRAAFTTSSEMLQEHGLAIERFLKATRRTLPDSPRAKLRTCLNETRLAATGWRRLIALARRTRTLG